MSRKILTTGFVWLAAMLPGGVLADAAEAENGRRLNVVFIVADDMNNHLGCYGFPSVKTPYIDRLARRGMRFDRAYCQVPLCNPSRVSYLSGLRPDRTQVFTLEQPTRSHLGDWVMLPQYFRQQGYFTAQAGKIYHTGDGFEDPPSWDVLFREFGKRPEDDEIIKWGNPDGPVRHTIDWAWLSTSDEDTPDGIQARKGVELIEQAVHDKQPFFVGIGFRRPHAPFAAPKEYFQLYPLDSIELPSEPPSGYYEGLLTAALNYGTPPEPLTELEQRELIASYYACNSFVDAQVGVVLDGLDRLDLWENTVVVFFGDHGYHLGDHGGLWHKNSLFEESCRVPLIIYAPGMQAAGESTARLVELIDLYPTLLSLCGLPEQKGLDGINIRKLLDDPNSRSKEAAYSLIARTADPSERVEDVEFLGSSVRTDRWRYTEWDEGRRGVELYDHQHDPNEWNNLAALPAHAETVRKLHKLLLAE